MPRALFATHKLPNFARSFNEKVTGNFQASNGLVIGMGLPIELICEELLNGAVSKLPGRQADGVQHQQVDQGASGACAMVGRLAFFSALAPALLPNVKAHGAQIGLSPEAWR